MPVKALFFDIKVLGDWQEKGRAFALPYQEVWD
jgi:hypothetical protein